MSPYVLNFYLKKKADRYTKAFSSNQISKSSLVLFFQFWRDDSPVIPCSTLTPIGIPIVLSNNRPRHLLAVPLLTKRIFKLNEWNQASHHICSTFQKYPTACFRNYKRSTKGKEPQCHKCWEQ